jgi:hypothetical protein
LGDTLEEDDVPDSSEADDAEYRISSFSGGGDCVAVARLPSGGYAIRHSRNDTLRIVFTSEEWSAFVAGVKAAEFDF